MVCYFFPSLIGVVALTEEPGANMPVLIVSLFMTLEICSIAPRYLITPNLGHAAGSR